MTYYYLDPMMPCEFGDGVVLDRSTKPPTVLKLAVRFKGWFGDALLECYPAFIGTDALMHAILDRHLSGTEIADVELSISDQYDPSYCEANDIPHFHWLKVVGVVGSDDFGIVSNHKLVVSERALKVLQTLGIENVEVKPY